MKPSVRPVRSALALALALAAMPAFAQTNVAKPDSISADTLSVRTAPKRLRKASPEKRMTAMVAAKKAKPRPDRKASAPSSCPR